MSARCRRSMPRRSRLWPRVGTPIPSPCSGRIRPRAGASFAPSCREPDRSMSLPARAARISAGFDRARAGLFEGLLASPRALSPADRMAGRHRGDGGPLRLRSSARRPRSASARGGAPLRARRCLGALADDDRRRRAACVSPSGRRMRAAWRSSATSTAWDERRHPMRLRHERGRLGAVRSAHRTGRSATNTRSSGPTARCCR